jgi:hypothetical protein
MYFLLTSAVYPEPTEQQAQPSFNRRSFIRPANPAATIVAIPRKPRRAPCDMGELR